MPCTCPTPGCFLKRKEVFNFFGVEGVDDFKSDTLIRIFPYEHSGESILRQEVMVADYYFDLILEHIGEGEYIEEMITPNAFFFDKPKDEVIDFEAIYERHEKAFSKFLDENGFENKNELFLPKGMKQLPAEQEEEEEEEEEIGSAEAEELITKGAELVREIKGERKDDVTEIVSDKKQLKNDEQQGEEVHKTKQLVPNTEVSKEMQVEQEKRDEEQEIEKVEKIDYVGKEEFLNDSSEKDKERQTTVGQ